MILDINLGIINTYLSRNFFTEVWTIVNRLLNLLKLTSEDNNDHNLKLINSINKNVRFIQKLENNKNLLLTYS
jgi:hypothetical protein